MANILHRRAFLANEPNLFLSCLLGIVTGICIFLGLYMIPGFLPRLPFTNVTESPNTSWLKALLSDSPQAYIIYGCFMGFGTLALWIANRCDHEQQARQAAAGGHLNRKAPARITIVVMLAEIALCCLYYVTRSSSVEQIDRKEVAISYASSFANALGISSLMESLSNPYFAFAILGFTVVFTSTTILTGFRIFNRKEWKQARTSADSGKKCCGKGCHKAPAHTVGASAKRSYASVCAQGL